MIRSKKIIAICLPGEIEDLTLTEHCASMAYPDAVAKEAAAAKGKTDLAGAPQGGGAGAQRSSSKRIKQSDTRPRNVGNVASECSIVIALAILAQPVQARIHQRRPPLLQAA